MFPYFQYHVGSGFIEGRFDVNEESHLALYARDGYDFVVAERPFSIDLYVKDGAIAHREVFPMENTTLRAAVGEQIEVKGLPLGSWVRLNYDTPGQTTNGCFGITKGSPGRVVVELAGHYWSNNKCWTLIWEEIGVLRTHADAAVDQGAELARMANTTDGAGQAMTYLRKAEAARLFVAGVELTEAQMARLTDEAERLGSSVEVAAQNIIVKADEWEARDALIDGIRLATKKEISEATTGVQIDNIVKHVVWPK
jgi:hypothetical protein